jgi:hypothetical protein
VPAGTLLDSRDWILIYTENPNGLQLEPAFVRLLDNTSMAPESQVTNLRFEDTDKRTGVIAGMIQWIEPPYLADITGYSVFMATDASGTERLTIRQSITVGTTQVFLPPTERRSRDWIVVYTENAYGMSSVPAAFHVFDDDGMPPNATVSSVLFWDVDTMEDSVNGIITWFEPEDSASVQYYAVYFVVEGEEEEQIAQIPFGTNQWPVPANTALNASRHYIKVVTGNVYGLQLPEVLEMPLYDNIGTVPGSFVTGVAATDMDDGLGQVSMTISWTPPTAEYFAVAVLFATDPQGSDRFQVGQDVPMGTNSLIVPAGTQLLGRDFVLVVVYNQTSSAFLAIPKSLKLHDDSLSVPQVSVSGVSFTDEDPNIRKIQGAISWVPPANVATINAYVVYLATDASGSSKTQLGQAVSYGTNFLNVLSGTDRGSRDYILVYTKNSVGEQQTPASARLLDKTLVPPLETVSNISFSDSDPTLASLKVWSHGYLQWILQQSLNIMSTWRRILQAPTDPRSAQVQWWWVRTASAYNQELRLICGITF